MEVNTNTKMKNDEIPPLEQLQNLISSLEQATLVSKQLLTATIIDPTQVRCIYAAAHNHLASFLTPPPQASAAAAVNTEQPEPMQIGDDDHDLVGAVEHHIEEVDSSKSMVDKVEERMRNCFIRNKRRKKRPISPSFAAEAEFRRVIDGGVRISEMGFDPNCTKFRSLDLIYQFHG